MQFVIFVFLDISSVYILTNNSSWFNQFICVVKLHFVVFEEHFRLVCYILKPEIVDYLHSHHCESFKVNLLIKWHWWEFELANFYRKMYLYVTSWLDYSKCSKNHLNINTEYSLKRRILKHHNTLHAHNHYCNPKTFNHEEAISRQHLLNHISDVQI